MATEQTRDKVDVIIDQWLQQTPDLNVPAKTLTIRLRRVTHHIEREVQRELSDRAIGLWEFEVLLALRRAPDHRMTAGELLRQSQVTAGAITNRITRLADRGWVRREVAPDDRRQVVVSLTRSGLRRAHKILDTKTQAEERLFAGLDQATVDRLNADLRALLVSIEGPADDYTPPAGEPAHRAPELSRSRG